MYTEGSGKKVEAGGRREGAGRGEGTFSGYTMGRVDGDGYGVDGAGVNGAG